MVLHGFAFIREIFRHQYLKAWYTGPLDTSSIRPDSPKPPIHADDGYFRQPLLANLVESEWIVHDANDGFHPTTRPGFVTVARSLRFAQCTAASAYIVRQNQRLGRFFADQFPPFSPPIFNDEISSLNNNLIEDLSSTEL